MVYTWVNLTKGEIVEDIPCKIQIESGSINGVPKMIWVDGIVKRKIDNHQYVVIVDGDEMFYAQSQEIFIDLYSVKLMLDNAL